jgi:hypothetical protein
VVVIRKYESNESLATTQGSERDVKPALRRS